MPELAEVDFFRRQWDVGLHARVLALKIHAGKRLFRGVDTLEMTRQLRGATLEQSQCHGKQMLFRFSGNNFLGLHLGMTGALSVQPSQYEPARHDHLVLEQEQRTLVFTDPRMFGRVQFQAGVDAPDWWRGLPPVPGTPGFDRARFQAILLRHAAQPLKALLLDQDSFPGVGNWMADEILWRARLRPTRRPKELTPATASRLWQAVHFVYRGAMRHVSPCFDDPPRSWLFQHRWKNGGQCPRDGATLRRQAVGGRTTAWCAECQL